MAVTGGAISTTGIAGLTLGGGLGWLMAKYGLAADNLLALELVDAEGEVLEVTEASDPDLFWALSGGGGNFGVVTTFTYRLQPVNMVTGGLIAHPIDAGPAMLRFYRDALAGASDDLTVFAGLVHAPDGSGMQLAAMVVFHTGTPDQAERDLAPFLGWGSPAAVQVGEMPYPVMNTLLDAGYPKGAAQLLAFELHARTDGRADRHDGRALRDGAVPDDGDPARALPRRGHAHPCGRDTAVPHREEGWNLLMPSVWMDPAETDANIAWTRETHAALRPHLDERRWLNYLGDDQEADAVKAAYGPNYNRLLAAKRRYDPGKRLPPQPQHRPELTDHLGSVPVRPGVRPHLLAPDPGCSSCRGQRRRRATRNGGSSGVVLQPGPSPCSPSGKAGSSIPSRARPAAKNGARSCASGRSK